MPAIKEIKKGKLIGVGGNEIIFPISPRAVPKPKTEEGRAQKMEGVVPNMTFAQEGEGFTLGELDQGSEVLREAQSRGADFIEIAAGTTDTVITRQVLPKRRNINKFR